MRCIFIIHLFQSTPEIDENGYYKKKNDCLITLRFDNIDDLKLKGFNNQNVLWGLAFKESGQKSNLIQVTMESSYGCWGDFECEQVIVVDIKDYNDD